MFKESFEIKSQASEELSVEELFIFNDKLYVEQNSEINLEGKYSFEAEEQEKYINVNFDNNYEYIEASYAVALEEISEVKEKESNKNLELRDTIFYRHDSLSSIFSSTITLTDRDDVYYGIFSGSPVGLEIYALAGNDEVIGTDHDDVIYGGDGNDYLNGRTGVDQIFGGAGNDIIQSYSGEDVIFGGSGNDYIYGAGDNEILHGDNGHDRIFADSDVNDYNNEVRDLVYGGAGNDYIVSRFGNDVLYGEDGNDIILGGIGTDTIEGGAGDDFISGGQGADIIKGGLGLDTVTYEKSTTGVYVDMSRHISDFGEARGDIIIDVENLKGSNFSDTLGGNSNNNILIGEDGVDILIGGMGSDWLFGGKGGGVSYVGGISTEPNGNDQVVDYFIFCEGNNIAYYFEFGIDKIAISSTYLNLYEGAVFIPEFDVSMLDIRFTDQNPSMATHIIISYSGNTFDMYNDRDNPYTFTNADFVII